MKKVISTILTIVMVLTAIPFGATKVSAAGYNATAVVNYAKKNWDNGVGLCAEFASNCLKAGGCNAWSVWVKDLRNELAYGGWGIEYVLKSSGGKVYKKENSGKIAAGDPILFWCKKCNSWMHAAICGGFDSNGIARAYGHNMEWNYIDNFATYIDENGHSGSNIVVYSVRMHSSKQKFGNADPNVYPVPIRSLSLASNRMVGADVCWMQAGLKKLGYTIGLDGEFGPKTEKVVKQFQTDYGLTVDGIFGAKSRAKLQSLIQCEHTYAPATCLQPKSCINCGIMEGEALGHSYTNACDADCNECGTTRTPAAHKGGIATCKEKAKCSVCGTVYGGLAAHQFSEYVYNNDATTAADGTKTRICSVCQTTETVTAEGTKIANPFTDVKADKFYTESVFWAVEKGITTGLTDITFGPDDTCTRAQIVTFLWRAAGKPAPKTTANPFNDVKKSDYFYDAVLWAVENDITQGTGNGTFSPKNHCTRDQVVTFLWRAMGRPASNTTNSFSDVKAGSFYYDAVLWAVETDITKGMGDGKFAPKNTCTRGQIVTFLYRAYK